MPIGLVLCYELFNPLFRFMRGEVYMVLHVLRAERVNDNVAVVCERHDGIRSVEVLEGSRVRLPEGHVRGRHIGQVGEAFALQGHPAHQKFTERPASVGSGKVDDEQALPLRGRRVRPVEVLNDGVQVRLVRRRVNDDSFPPLFGAAS